MSNDWKIFKLQLAALGGLLFLSLAVTWVILYYVRLLDHPNERSSHVKATPKCGGVGVVVSFVAGVWLSQVWGGTYLVKPVVLYSLIVPILMVAGISLMDDIRELSPTVRLGVQGVAAMSSIVLSRAGINYNGMGALPVLVGLVFFVIAVVWIVGMANAFNFMDGIDGLAAGQGLIVSFFFGVIQFGRGESFLGFVSLVLMVGCLGLLTFNFPPAKVFMGDVGSVSIGFVLALLAVISYQKQPSIESMMVMPLLMSNFLFDSITTFVRRLIKKESVFEAHRSHLYQKFAECGFSQRTVTMTNYGMAIIQGLLVLLFGSRTPEVLMACLGMATGYMLFVQVQLQRRGLSL